ncbi:hypothetical protein COY07_02605 [Candidatus Peregrinibacteria bacterium CG_4_10_14_0_2_um_filter_43_11]|nr:MAG: hypothetical protein COY07_02605 [Candidatus Peregrinibacteria bacterium CG_4_10_14_0_2_um_filter_43_11]
MLLKSLDLFLELEPFDDGQVSHHPISPHSDAFLREYPDLVAQAELIEDHRVITRGVLIDAGLRIVGPRFTNYISGNDLAVERTRFVVTFNGFRPNHGTQQVSVDPLERVHAVSTTTLWPTSGGGIYAPLSVAVGKRDRFFNTTPAFFTLNTVPEEALRATRGAPEERLA